MSEVGTDLDDLRRFGLGWWDEFWVLGVEVEAGFFDDVADERVAVAVDAVAGQPQDDVASVDAGGFLDAAEFDDTDAETGEVKVALGVEVGHVGGFAAEEGAAAAAASIGDASDQVAQELGIDDGGGDVVEKEEGLGALHDQVVDVHRDQVDADGVEDSKVRGELDLCANAVTAGHQDRVFVVALEEALLVVQAEEAGEAPGVGDDAVGVGSAQDRIEGLGEGVLAVDVDARVGIRQGAAVGGWGTVGLGKVLCGLGGHGWRKDMGGCGPGPGSRDSLSFRRAAGV